MLFEEGQALMVSVELICSFAVDEMPLSSEEREKLYSLMEGRPSRSPPDPVLQATGASTLAFDAAVGNKDLLERRLGGVSLFRWCAPVFRTREG